MMLFDADNVQAVTDETSVLILVIVDDTLWWKNNQGIHYPWKVLILVIVDDTLWVQIVMDRGLIKHVS